MAGKNYTEALRALVSGKGVRLDNWLDPDAVVRVHDDETVDVTPVDRSFAQMHIMEAQYVLEECAANLGVAKFPIKMCLHTATDEFAHLSWMPRKKDMEATNWVIVD